MKNGNLGILLVFSLISGAIAGDKSLYNDTDAVIDFKLKDSDQLLGSGHLWFVEFYAHWCGHCQRFAPAWKHIAEILKPWNEHIKMAAVNCAVEDCSDFNIQGTPTVRVFYPGVEPEHGKEIVANPLFIFAIMIDEIKERRSKDEVTPAKYPDFNKYEDPTADEAYSKTGASHVAFLFEEEIDALWTYIVLLGEGNDPNLNIKTVALENEKLQTHLGVEKRPAVVLMSRDEGSMKRVFYPDLSQEKSVPDQVVQFLDGILHANSLTTEGPVTHTQAAQKIKSSKDIVFEGDLERVVRYLVTVEIPMHRNITGLRLSALNDLLGVLIKHLPIRRNIIYFLIHLREWTLSKTSILNEDFEAKVEELVQMHQPFKYTPDNWIGCKGSQPRLRGYPCGAWTLFHVLTVDSMKNDTPSGSSSNSSSAISQAMIGYVEYFFSCRHCAKNYQTKVSHLGSLPTNPSDTIIWLWKIHNMANKVLKGDLTEDPLHPKVIWPTKENCPECRSSEGEIILHEEHWDKNKLLEYMASVYKSSSIAVFDENGNKVEEKLIMDIMAGNLISKEEIKKRLSEYCSQF